MGNYTKINLLFLSILVLLMSFTAKDEETESPNNASTYINAGSLNYYTFSVVPSIGLKSLINIPASQIFEDATKSELKTTFVKQRKKCKRLVNSLCSGIQPPVKEIDPAEFNIFWKDSYSKPYFLSHIHSFVFRLTPF
jgi:hypothetical protein